MIRFIFLITVSIFIASINFAQETPCINGEAGIYPCRNVSLLARLNPSDLLAEFDFNWNNDIWGWTDPLTSIEYVIIGAPNGTTFVEISNPEVPKVVGFLPSHVDFTSPWRDIKVYNNYAFIVSEALGHGMQVFDLTRLRDATNGTTRFDEDAHYDGISNAHNIAIDTVAGYAYAVRATNGNTCSRGGLHIIDIRDPLTPTYAGCYDNVGTIHDTQCVTYHGPDERFSGSEICFNSSESSITIVDVTDKEATTRLASGSYSRLTYTHQGWLTEDHKYFLCNDELDELEWGNNTRTLIWDVSDLENPELIGEHFGGSQAIDHNLYIHNGLVFESNYTRGLRILETSDIEEGKLTEIAYFDSYPSNDNTELIGNWSNYPFFKSGVVAISDMRSGLFLLKPNLVTSSTDLLGELDVFPIPSSSTLTITGAAELKILDLQIIDSSGKAISIDNYNMVESDIILSVDNLKSGIYYLSISSDNSFFRKRFTVLK